MKCKECPEYQECVKNSNLTMKRKRCSKTKEEKPMTNGDRIRAMTDEELAKALGFITHLSECLNPECGNCRKCEVYELCNLQPGQELEWLQQPVKGDAE